MLPRIVDHTPVVEAAQQDAREMGGRFVLVALARLRAMALRRNPLPPVVVRRPVLRWRGSETI